MIILTPVMITLVLAKIILVPNKITPALAKKKKKKPRSCTPIVV